MATKVNSYKCDICGAYYIKKQDAIECEKLHKAASKLEIGSVFYKRDYEYPFIITLDDGSGHGAMYTQNLEGSVEDVYEEFERQRKYELINQDDEGY